jgi:hypothetical protein
VTGARRRRRKRQSMKAKASAKTAKASIVESDERFGNAKGKKAQTAELRALALKYIGGAGLGIFLSGFFYQLAATSWIATGAIYLGVTLIGVDVATKHSFRSGNLLTRTVVASIFAVSITILSLWMFASAPLTMASESRLALYPAGSLVSGIEWKDTYSELSVQIANNSPYDYSNLVVRIETDLGIAQLRAEESYFNCAIFPDVPPVEAPRVTSRWLDARGKLHAIEGVTEPLEGGWAYRISCEKFPHDARIDLVGALTNQNFKLELGQPLYLPPRPARWVKVNSSYDFRTPRTANRTDCFLGDCADSLAPPSAFRYDPQTTIALLKQQSASRKRALATAVISGLVFGILVVAEDRLSRKRV